MDLADRLVALLGDRGPLSPEAAAGLLETSLEKILEASDDPRVMFTHGGVDLVARVLNGRVFVVRPNPDDTIDPYPDLAALVSLWHQGLTADAPGVDGAFLSYDPRAGALSGPDGWLGSRPDLVAVRVVDAADGIVAITPTTPRPPSDLDVARVRATLQRVTYDDAASRQSAPGAFVDEAAIALCAEHPALFTQAGATLSELVQAAGYEVYRKRVIVPDDADPAGWDEEIDADESDDLIDDDELDDILTDNEDEDDGGLPTLLDLAGPAARHLEELVSIETPVDTGELAELLADHNACALLFGLAVRHPEHLEAAAIAVVSDNPEHAGALHARAAVALARGDAHGAEALLGHAVEHGAAFEAFEKLAELRSEAGDARGAVALLRRAGVPEEDKVLQRLREMEARPKAQAGRNDPCPCGSGKKYKRCCGDPARPVPLADRVSWMLDKLLAYANDARYRATVLDVLEQMYRTHDPRELGDGLVFDAVLYTAVAPGCPLLDAFLAERGHRLPADERELFERWRHTELVVTEVMEARPGIGLSLRLVGTEDRIEVRERTASRTLRAGETLLTRIVPDGTGHQLVLCIHVPRMMRAQVSDGLREGHVALGRAIGRLRAGPMVTTTDGQTIVFVRRTWRVREDARTTLDALFDAQDDERWLWHNKKGYIAAKLELSGDELVVEMMSLERAEAVEELLGPVLVEMVDEEVREPDEGNGRAPLHEAPSPEMLEALGGFIEQLEERWIDEPVPALGGLTPRQAARTPKARTELDELLRDFEAKRGPGTFDARRLRELLGMR